MFSFVAWVGGTVIAVTVAFITFRTLLLIRRNKQLGREAVKKLEAAMASGQIEIAEAKILLLELIDNTNWTDLIISLKVKKCHFFKSEEIFSFLNKK